VGQRSEASERLVISGRDALVSYGRYFGAPVTITCDMKCNKAWGINARPRVYLTDEEEDPDDYAFLADDEVGEAPAEPGSWEGPDTKPLEVPEEHNKWCVRECERSETCDRGKPLTLRDFSRRVANRGDRTGYER
jgi:hypothetical protein